MPTSRTNPAPRPPFLATRNEFGACGVGFVASREGRSSHELLQDGLAALVCHEHRGACGADGRPSAR